MKNFSPFLAALILSFTIQSCSVIAQQKPIKKLHTLGSILNSMEDSGSDAISTDIEAGGTAKKNESFEGRKYVMYLPKGHDAAIPTPLVLTMHGSGGSALKFYNQRNPELLARADERGWIIVFPDGTPCHDKNGLCFMAKDTHLPDAVDDVGYLSRLIDHIGTTTSLESDSIYAMGFSNGGGMAERLGAELPEVFAAVSSVGSMTTGYDGANQVSKSIPPPTAPISVLLVRGLEDARRPYEGIGPLDDGSWVGSAKEDGKFWAEANGCDLSMMRKRYKRENAGMEGYDQCNGGTEVVLISVRTMPHQWPDRLDGYGFDANRRILQFFARHSLSSKMAP